MSSGDGPRDDRTPIVSDQMHRIERQLVTETEDIGDQLGQSVSLDTVGPGAGRTTALIRRPRRHTVGGESGGYRLPRGGALRKAMQENGIDFTRTATDVDVENELTDTHLAHSNGSSHLCMLAAGRSSMTSS